MAQFADYDVHRTPASSNAPLHPESLSSYSTDPFEDSSQSQHPVPSVLTSNVDQHSSNAQPVFAQHRDAGSSNPADFYTQYRQSFRARGPGGIYGLGADAEVGDSDKMPAVMRPTTVSHFESKTNGIPATSVTVRLNNLAKKASQEGLGRRDTGIASGIPRGRQSSLKALVNKFEQSPDQVLPIPSSRSASRSTSTHTSPSTTFNSRSFRARTPSATPSDRSRAERRISGTDRAPFDGNGLNIRKRNVKRTSQELRAANTDSNRRISAQSTNHSVASQSMVNLAFEAGSADQRRRPLFGEIVAGEADHGWGLPQPRRGSEGGIRRPSSMFRDDTELGLNPPSVEAWYSGQGSLDELDFSKLHPRTGALQHRRSRSDLSGLKSTSQASRSRAGSTTPTKFSRHSKLPVRTKATSDTSDTEAGGFPVRAGFFTESHNTRSHLPSPIRTGTQTSVGPKKSPRRTAPTSIHASPRLAAYVNDGAVGEPARSPLLRSSRHRQSMVKAPAATSRGNTVERAATVGSGSARSDTKIPKALPELGGVDFAARRERIQRAFSRSVEEKEAEQRRSLILEAHRRKQEEVEIPPVPAISDRFQDSFEGEPTQTQLRVDTQRTIGLSDSLRRGSADDSPTLGTLNLLQSTDEPSSPSERRSSLASTGTYLDEEPQDNSETQPRPEDENGGQRDIEGVHIVLEGTASTDTAPLPTDSRWSLSSWTSSVDSNVRYSTDRADPRLETLHEINDSNDNKPEHRHLSGSGTSGTEQSVWPSAPRIPERTSSTNLAGDATLTQSSTQRDSLSPSAASGGIAKYAQRASLVNLADFAAASPSIGDWMVHQAEDTPIEERSKDSFSDRVAQTASTKPTGLRRPGSRPLTPKMGESPQLPEIKTANSDWGIVNMRSDSPRSDTGTKQPTYRVPAPPRNPSAGLQVTTTSAAEIPAPEEKRASISPRRGLISKYNSTADSADATGPAERAAIRPPSARSEKFRDEGELKRGPESVMTNRVQSSQPKPLTEEEQKLREAEQKRLVRRKNIIKELVDTESSFGKDMTVVVDIYKETSHVILQNPDDVRILFGNAAEIVQFSMRFLDALKLAANSVYKLPRSKRWKSNRDSAATADSSNGDESSINSMDLSDDERDRLTSIGYCFEQHMVEMEKLYTDYLKNHELASAKLLQLQKSDKVQIWLSECVSYAHDLTSAWNLDSLLVKPVQRILKYPLLLRELVEVTPENHPDFLLLDNASREIVGLSQRINSAKKRADLVSKTIEKPVKDRKKGSEESRNVFSKTFGRNKEKFRQQVGLSDLVQDKTYNMLADKFGSHFFQVQVVMRDVEVYTVDVQKWVQKFEDFVVGIEQFMDVAQSPYPEVESKWRMFRNSVREIQVTALTDHLAAVRRSVIEPMSTLLKLYDGPQRMMEKRKKRAVDHARWKQATDAGAKVDKKIQEQAEQFIALNDTLKEELPKLFAGTKTLVETCLNNFVQLQLQWTKIWRRKLTSAIDMRNPPREIQDIIEGFTGDFKFTEAQVLNLGICNGALLADDVPVFNSSATTLNGDASSSRQTSLTYDDAREARMAVNQAANSRNRAASAHSHHAYQNANVPYLPAAYAQGPSTRHRANSTASGRSREQQTWATNSGNLPVSSPQGSAPPSTRPSSQSQRGSNIAYGQNVYDPSSYMRYSEESSRSSSHWYHNLQGHGSGSRPVENQYGIGAALAGASGAAAAPANPRGSAIFSSALPPSDTPPQSASLHASMYSQTSSIDPNAEHDRHSSRTQSQLKVMFLAASVYEFNIDRARREAGYPYLTYAAGEIFDVIGEKGELWLAKNQDDPSETLGWIWSKHFARLVTES